MISFLLALTSVCPVPFTTYVAAAQRQLSVEQQLFVQIAPNKAAVLGINSKGKQLETPAVAWIMREPDFNSTIFIRFNMLHAMDCDALRLIALHEVCHVSLQHQWNRTPSLREATLHEKEAEACSIKVLGRETWDAFQASIYSGYQLTLQEEIEPPRGFFNKEHRRAVPTRPSTLSRATIP